MLLKETYFIQNHSAGAEVAKHSLLDPERFC